MNAMDAHAPCSRVASAHWDRPMAEALRKRIVAECRPAFEEFKYSTTLPG